MNDVRRPRRRKPKAEIVLICNPRAGGRWKELARILDSDEARDVRRIVTDSVEDIAPAVADLGREAKLLCIYGGDGTIQRVIDRVAAEKTGAHIALLGGGTMNVTSRWLGFYRSPMANFRHVVRTFRSGDLLLKEVPILEVRAGDSFHRGFTFGTGPIVRVLDAYERGPKGKKAALAIGLRAVMATLLNAGDMTELLQPMQATVTLDDEELPYHEFSALFANVTGQINLGVEPFAEERTRDSFYTAAYAVTARELAVSLPMVMRGWIPKDVSALLRPWRKGDGPALPNDPRYVNRSAARMSIETGEQLYTVDGEVLVSRGTSFQVSLGPVLKLAAGPKATFAQSIKAARAAIGA